MKPAKASAALLLLLTARMPVRAQPPSRASAENERALDRQLAADFRRRSHPIASPALQPYLDRLGRMLAPQLPNVPFPFSFSGVAEDACGAPHEPTALPGGSVFVPAALFLEAQTEDEFAGMLAHAMAHIALHHGMREVTRASAALASVPLIFIGASGSCSNVIPMGLRAARQRDEFEADALALYTIAQVGFDTGALARYLERFPRLPNYDRRLSAVRAATEPLTPVDRTAGSSEEFTRAQQAIRALSEAAAPRPSPPSLLRNPQR